MSRAALVDTHMLAPGFKHGLFFPTDSCAVLQVQSLAALLPVDADWLPFRTKFCLLTQSLCHLPAHVLARA